MNIHAHIAATTTNARAVVTLHVGDHQITLLFDGPDQVEQLAAVLHYEAQAAKLGETRRTP